MASKLRCDICLRRGKTTVAIKFCSDCEDKLCTECAEVHGMFKAFVSHHVIDINLASDQSFEIQKYCSKHSEMSLEFYCSDHDALCCRSCMADEHRTCGKLLPLEVAARDIKLSVIFGDISADVEQLNRTATSLEDVKGKFSTILEGSKTDVKKKISNLKAKLLERINQIELKCLSDVDTVYSKLLSKNQTKEKNVESRIQAIQDISRRFDLVTKHGSESQIFLMLNSIKSEINKTSSDLEGFVPTLKFQSITFEGGNLGQLISSLGSVTDIESACNVQYKTLQNQRAQIIQRESRFLNKLQLEKNITLESGRFPSGIGFTRNNQILICQQQKYNLIVLSDQGEQLQTITLSSRPWDIAILPDSDEAWITLPECTYVQVVNTETSVPTRQVKLQSSGYYGIAVLGDNIALGHSGGKVDVINKKGVLIKSYKIGNSWLYSLCASRNITNKLYCCETEKGSLHCINLDGSVVFRDTSLTRPIGVVTDSHGNLYVFDYINNKLHRFSDDGKPMDIILTPEDGLKQPYACIFNANFTKLFVLNCSNASMLIFSCK